MTDFVIPFRRCEVPAGPNYLGYQLEPATVIRDRPAWLRHLRIYEPAIKAKDDAALAVIADALELHDKNSVDDIIREYGVVGCWRPSTIIVRRLFCQGTARILAENTIAHALWNVDLHHPIQRHFAIELAVDNEEDEPRVLRPVLVCTEMTDDELEPMTSNGQTEIAQLRREVTGLTKAVKLLGSFAKTTNGPLMSVLIDRAKKAEE